MLGAFFGAALPVLLYAILRKVVHSDAGALAIAGAIPAAWVIVGLIWRRQVEWIALIVVVGLLLAGGISLLSGGSSLPLKLRTAGFTSVLGLACVVSCAVGRPLPILILRLRSRRDEQQARALVWVTSDPGRRRAVVVVTVLIGVALLANAAVETGLALSVSTTQFLIASRVSRASIYGAGVLAILGYLRRHRSRGDG
jgi:hypothetical protein